ARAVAGEKLQRDERRPTARRALVLEPALEKLELLAVAELADRAIRDRAHAVVGVARRALDLVLPLAPEIRELALVAGLGELLRLRGSLGERQRADATGYSRGSGPTYSAPGRMILLSACCSRTCAAWPATRLHSKSGVKRSVGMPR